MDLDSLLADLETTSNGPAAAAAPAPAPTSKPSGSADVDELESLMNDLDIISGDAKPVAPVAKPAAPAANTMDDLDALISNLDTSPAAAAVTPTHKANPYSGVPTTTPPAAANDMDDLDALINNLETPAAAPKPAAAPAANNNNVDDLDALISNLDAPAAAAPPPRPPKQQQAAAPVRANPYNAAPQPQNDMDDLDSLINGLDMAASAAPPPRPPKQQESAPPPRPPKNNDMDDLDSLINGLDMAASAAPPQRPPKQQQQQPAHIAAPPPQNDMDDLDSLINGLDMAAKAPAPAPAPAPAKPAKPAASSTEDALDDLLGELNMASAAPAAAPAHQPPRASPYGGAPAANVYGGNSGGGGGDEIDTLLGGLSSDMNNITPTAVNAPAGSGPVRGICGRCGQPIRGECINAMGKTWHPEHFVCGTCQQPIGTRTFYESNGQPNCDRCWKNLFCPRCAHCDQPIADRCITALGKKWHPEHFICTQCLQPLNSGFFAREGKPFCEKCFYGAFSAKCAGCNQPIRGECINALGQKWHPDHFTCFYCHKAFTDGAFFEHQGKPYCETHYHQMTGEVCAGCNRPVGNRSITAMGKKWHPEHFVCAFCNNTMSSGSYKENDGKPYCGSCYTKLFG